MTKPPATLAVETRQLLRLAGPAILAQLAQMGMGVIDTLMAGRYSADALAAVAIGVSLFNPVIVFIIGIFLALNPMVAQSFGRGDFDGVRRSFQLGVVMAVILSLPSFLIVRSLEPAMLAIGINDTIVPLANGYLQALAWGMLPLMLFFALKFCNEGMFATKAIMYCSLAALPFNVGFNYWFINGGLGLPAMGAVGVGWATDLVWLLMMIFLLGYTLLSRRYHDYPIFARWLYPRWQHYREMLRIGIPMGMSLGLEVAMFGAIGLMIGRYSIADIAGHQIALNIASLAFTLSLGLSIAVTARVGYHVGRDDMPRARQSGLLGMGCGLVITLATALIMVLFDDPLTALFTSDPQVSAIAIQLLLFAALFQLSDGLQVNANGALRGMKDTKAPMYICTVAYWLVGFPLGYLLAEHAGMGVSGYWMAIIAGLTLAAILLSRRFLILTKGATASGND